MTPSQTNSFVILQKGSVTQELGLWLMSKALAAKAVSNRTECFLRKYLSSFSHILLVIPEIRKQKQLDETSWLLARIE